MDAMRAYAEGYRRLAGELQDFRPDWAREQRQQAVAHYRDWIDPREISHLIHQHRSVLQAVRASGAGLDDEIGEHLGQFIQAASEFLDKAAEPLLRLKASDERRARVTDALTGAHSTEQAQPVSDWVYETRAYLADGQAPLAAASEQMTALKTRLTALNHFTVLPAAQPPETKQPQAKQSWLQRFVAWFTGRG